ncbi:unnamed protein product [Schistocephalus solidus]|uniref:Uncharacterized protein n=1 Tax=Schistocephalus solidus TaxID=70667 RepID=A0A183SH23_SCHSO|nr:unnamed protein product [Schistocephalus solidus]
MDCSASVFWETVNASTATASRRLPFEYTRCSDSHVGYCAKPRRTVTRLWQHKRLQHSPMQLSETNCPHQFLSHNLLAFQLDTAADAAASSWSLVPSGIRK